MTIHPNLTIRPVLACEISILPPEHPRHYYYAVHVTEDPNVRDTYRVMAGDCPILHLNADGEWDAEPRRADETWHRAHRLTFAQAMNLAQAAAPDVDLNGVSAAQALDRWEATTRD